MCHVTVIYDTWQVTHDTWHMTVDVGWTFSQNFSSLAHQVWDWLCWEDIVTKGSLTHLMNQSMNDGGYCRTAPATPGLLMIKNWSRTQIDLWHVTGYLWQVTIDTGHMTHDTWHMRHSIGWTFSQNFSSLALTVCDLWYYEDLEEKDHWLT